MCQYLHKTFQKIKIGITSSLVCAPAPKLKKVNNQLISSKEQETQTNTMAEFNGKIGNLYKYM